MATSVCEVAPSVSEKRGYRIGKRALDILLSLPAGILSLIRKYGLKKDECAMGGDSDVDLILARNASIPHTVAVAWGYRPLGELFAEHPEAVIYRPRELLSLPFVTE